MIPEPAEVPGISSGTSSRAVSGSSNNHRHAGDAPQLIRAAGEGGEQDAECVIPALTAKVQQLPEQLKQSLTWDRIAGQQELTPCGHQRHPVPCDAWKQL